MNVLVIAEYFPPDIGGAATRAWNMARALSSNGCNVTVIAAVPFYPHGKIPKEYRWRPLKTEWSGNIRLIRTFMPPLKSLGFLSRLMLIGCFAISSLFALPLVGKVDAIFGSSWIPSVIYSKVKRVPVALNEDDLTLEDLVDLDLMNEKSLILKTAETIYRVFLFKGDAVASISPGYVKTLTRKYCVRPERVHIVRGGVDLSLFKKINHKKSNEKFVALYSGAFSIAYDFELMVKAAKFIEKNYPDIEFIIQGKGEQLGFIRSKVADLKVSNVKVIDKLLSRDKVAELLSSADVLVLPLVRFKKPYLGMSSKLYEFQAAQKPIICCSEGVPEQFIKQTNSGLTVKPGDFEGLAKAVIDLKNKPEKAKMLAENGRTYVENEGSIEAIGQRMKEIFKKLKDPNENCL